MSYNVCHFILEYSSSNFVNSLLILELEHGIQAKENRTSSCLLVSKGVVKPLHVARWAGFLCFSVVCSYLQYMAEADSQNDLFILRSTSPKGAWGLRSTWPDKRKQCIFDSTKHKTSIFISCANLPLESQFKELLASIFLIMTALHVYCWLGFVLTQSPEFYLFIYLFIYLCIIHFYYFNLQLAYYYQRKGWKTCLICADTFRAGKLKEKIKSSIFCLKDIICPLGGILISERQWPAH